MTTGKILHVCASDKKGTPKTALPSVTLQVNHGIVGDAHAGNWHRQISLLDDADIDTLRAKGLDPQPGAFGENLIIRGVDLGALGIGSRLQTGDAELELTQLGKVCHNRCAIHHRTGDCIMPRVGIFARVLRGGEVKPFAPVHVLALVPRTTIQAAVITVSDSRSDGDAEDTAGPAVARMLTEHLDAHIAAHIVVPDDLDRIKEALHDFAGRSCDLVVTVGGTGFGPRDVTPEATRAVIEREAPGLAESMRATSLTVTPHAMLQRGVCGLRGRALIINLPGSERGSTENLAAIAHVLPHAIDLVRGNTNHTSDPPTSPSTR